MRYAISQGYNKSATGSALHLSRRDALHPICPALERCPHLVGVFGALINASNTTAMATIVIQDRFCVMWLDPKFTKVGCAGAT